MKNSKIFAKILPIVGVILMLASVGFYAMNDEISFFSTFVFALGAISLLGGLLLTILPGFDIDLSKSKNPDLVPTIIVIILLIIIVGSFTTMCDFGSGGGGSNRCNHASCKENGPFYCMGKNNTCKNKVYCAYDLYCNECD